MNHLTKDIWKRMDAGDVSKNPYLMGKKEDTPSIITPANSIDLGILEMDLKPALNGIRKKQDDWIKYWNNQNDGIYMASTADFYKIFKKLKISIESGTEAEKKNAENLIANLRKDFKDKQIISSTRIHYNTNPNNDLEGKIIHHYKSKNPVLTKEITLNILEYSGDNIATVLSSAGGLKYLRAYFDTEDDKEIIMQTMEFISERKRGSITVLTADLNHRASVPERAAFLSYSSFGNFRIGGYNLYNSGRSRGVRYK